MSNNEQETPQERLTHCELPLKVKFKHPLLIT